MVVTKYLDPKNDIAFKRIFGTEKNKDILICLLNEVLRNQLDNKILDVSFLKPHQDPDISSKKQSIVDVLCKDTDGHYYIIEMQVANSEGFQKRAQYYAYKAYVSQMDTGGRYEDLKKVIFLAFTDFVLFPNKTEYKSEHITLDRETYEHDLSDMSFTFVDLVKFGISVNKPVASLSLEEKFYYFLHYAPEASSSDRAALISSSSILSKAYRELERFNWTEEELLTYESEEKRIKDNEAILTYARREGIKEGIQKGMKKGIRKGIQKGIKEGNYLTARKMLSLGIAVRTIKEVTGLTVKQIEEIQRKL